MTDKVQKIREEVERLRNLHQIKYQNLGTNDNTCLVECGKRNLCNELLSFIDSLQGEPVSEELEEFALQYAGHHAPYDSCWQEVEDAVKAGAQWQKEHLWKPADGDDLPEIDREVIVLIQDYSDDKDHLRVAFAHRPSKYTKVWNSDLGEEQVVEIERYGKGEWNIPNVKYWLDTYLPNMED